MQIKAQICAHAAWKQCKAEFSVSLNLSKILMQISLPSVYTCLSCLLTIATYTPEHMGMSRRPDCCMGGLYIPPNH